MIYELLLNHINWCFLPAPTISIMATEIDKHQPSTLRLYPLIAGCSLLSR